MPTGGTRWLVGLLLLTSALAGCIGNDDLEANRLDATTPALTILDSQGQALPSAQVTALSAEDRPIAALTTSAQGTLIQAQIPGDATRLTATAPGYATASVATSELPATLELAPLDRDQLDPEDPAPALRFLDPLELGTAYLGDQEASCEVYNCGASEPVIEVAGDGTIYVSGVCCIGESPPIWYSQDGGQTFQLLEGDVLRDNFGIEGDFAIDEAGNLYFTDISVASAYIASWDGDQEHRHTLPAGPFKPIVDRPWVRAGAEDHAWFLYNTGTTTELYETTDGGLTWLPLHSFEGSLGSFDNGPEQDHLWVTVRGTLYESTDGGQTWSQGTEVPTPTDEGTTFQAYWVPVVDEAGNVWVVYDWKDGDDEEGPYHVYAARYDPSGTWHGPYQVSPDNGTHHLPWAATGEEGTLAVAWYGTSDDDAGPNTVDEEARWYVEAAVSLDADQEAPSFQRAKADPKPVHEGPMNRKLLDFLQIEVSPDGAIHIAYAQDREGQPDEATNYVRSTTGLQLQPATYLAGP